MSVPLNAFKILDNKTLLSGPYATTCLPYMGAHVLKITLGSRPDLSDFVPPFVPGTKLSEATAYRGRGKQLINFNLKHLQAAKIVHQLVSDYDSIVEGFCPGVMAKFGLDYNSLKRINPAVICCSITGYSQTGPFHKKGGIINVA